MELHKKERKEIDSKIRGWGDVRWRPWGYAAQPFPRATRGSRWMRCISLWFSLLRVFGSSCLLSVPLLAFLRWMIDARLVASKMFSVRVLPTRSPEITYHDWWRCENPSISTCLGGIVFRMDFREYSVFSHRQLVIVGDRSCSKVWKLPYFFFSFFSLPSFWKKRYPLRC